MFRVRTPTGRSFTRTLSLAAAIGVFASSATAVRYEVVEGEITYTESGETKPLEGFLNAGRPEFPNDIEGSEILIIDDFELVADGQHFGPGAPVEYEGFRPAVWVANTLHLAEDGAIPYFMLRSGGELVGADDDTVTFRFIDWWGNPDSNSTRGTLSNGLPARINSRGELIAVEQSYRLPAEACPIPTAVLDPPILTPPEPQPCTGCQAGSVISVVSPGIGIISGGIQTGVTLTITNSGPLISGATIPERPAGGGSASISVVGGSTLIAGALRPGIVGAVDPMLRPGADVGAIAIIAATSAPPLGDDEASSILGSVRVPSGELTLEALGMSAPSGATIVFEDGVLTIRTEGDLRVDGPIPQIEGLRELQLIAGGHIEIHADLDVPSSSVADGGAPLVQPTPIAGENVVLRPFTQVPPFCELLSPIAGPPPRRIGSFELSAAVVERVDIAIEPRRNRRPINPLRRTKLRVAIFGSADFDVRDVRVHSLRLGPDAAPPAGRRRVRLRDVNRDGLHDLVVRFRTDETGVSEGDTSLCLRGESAVGTTIRGCAPIDTRPRGHGGWHRGRPGYPHHRHGRHARDDD